MGEQYRADYRLLEVREHLGENPDALDVPWAEFVGDRSSEQRFRVSTDDATGPYLELQAYSVDAYGHDIVVNGNPLSGFDVPPGDGWQYWMTKIDPADLRAGENTLRIHRDATTHDEFVVGTITVHWRVPV